MTIWTQNCAVIDTGNQPFLVMVNKQAENSYSINLQLGNMPIQVAEYDTEESAFEELKEFCIQKQTSNFYEFRKEIEEENETSEENA